MLPYFQDEPASLSTLAFYLECPISGSELGKPGIYQWEIAVTATINAETLHSSENGEFEIQ